MKRLILGFGAVTLLLAAVGVAKADPTITNGDFQAGNIGFSSDYASDQISGGLGIGTAAGTYDVVNNPFGDPPSQNKYVPPGYFDHTLGTTSGLMFAANGATDASQRAWYESVSGLTVGQTYSLSFWSSNWSFDPVANLQVTVNGVAQGPSFLAPENSGVWQEHSILWTATGTTAVFAISDLQTAANGNDFALDDIRLSAVPVPSTLAMSSILLGMLGVVWSYRRLRRPTTAV